MLTFIFIPCLFTEGRLISPNCEEAFSFLGVTESHPTRGTIEKACAQFLEFGVGKNGQGWIIIRSGHLGACVAKRGETLLWIDAFFQDKDEKEGRIVDVTGMLLGALCICLIST
jgi:hydroxymethylpyrimidine/phosphomethylpyrimidine kinase